MILKTNWGNYLNNTYYYLTLLYMNSYNSDINNSINKNDTDDTMVYIPKKKLIEHEAKERELNEKLNIIQDTLKRKNEGQTKLKDINNNMSEHSHISISSIFKKKGANNESKKKVLSQQGGNKSDKNIKSHKSEEKVKNKKHAKIKSESESEDEESETSDDESESGSSNYTDSNSSTSYEDTSDIYRATETDDGINKAYSKINREMEFIEKKQNGGKMTGREVVKRINFLLNGLRILDNVKKE